MDAHVRLRDDEHADAQPFSRAGVSGPVVFEGTPLAEYLHNVMPDERGEAVPAVQNVAEEDMVEAHMQQDDEQLNGSKDAGGAAGPADVDAELLQASLLANRLAAGTTDASASNNATTVPARHAQIVALQERLNHVLVSYLSSPSHITGALELFEDEDPRALGSGTGRQQQQHGPTDGSGPVILTRRGQMILLSLFGILFAYPYLPVPTASSYLPSSIVSLWKATPPVLVATGIATIWAGQQQQHLQYASTRLPAHSTGSIESELELVLAQLGGTVKTFLRALNSYDEIVERCLQALDALEAALGRSSGGQTSQKTDRAEGDDLLALPVREAVLANLVSVEIAMKVALGGVANEEKTSQVTRKSPSQTTSVVNREEMERLVEMYAQQVSDGSVRNPATSPYSEYGPTSPRRLRRPMSFYQPRIRDSQVPQSTHQRDSMPPMHRVSPREGGDQVVAPIPPRQRVSPQLAYLYGADGQANPSRRVAESPIRRDTRRASWTGYSPGLATGSLLHHQSPARSTQHTSPVSSAYATFSPSSPNSPGTLKKQKTRRRQSDQLPSSPNTWAQQQARVVGTGAPHHGVASSPMRGSLSSDSPLPQSVWLSASFRAVMDSPSRPSGISSALLAAESLQVGDEDNEHDPSVRDRERAKAMQRIQSTAAVLRPGQQEVAPRDAHRPLSMFELNFNRSAKQSTSESLLSSSAPIGHGSFEDRRWSVHPVQTAGWSSSGWNTGLPRPQMRTVRQRPSSLYIQCSSIDASADKAALKSPPLQLPGVSHIDRHDGGKLGLFALASRGAEEKRMRRELICYLLAVQYTDPVPSPGMGHAEEADKKRQARNEAVIHFLLAFRQVVVDLVKVLSNESAALSAALEKEVGSSAAAVLAPPLSPLPATPRRNSIRSRRTSRSRTPVRERGLQIEFPGQYPRSPLIEVDPATPPASLSPRQDALPDEPEGKEYPFGLKESSTGPHDASSAASNFAPRDPLSAEERQADATLAAAAQSSQEALRAITAKMYMERKDLQKHVTAVQGGNASDSKSSSRLDELSQRHESMRQDLEILLRDWNEGRVALRRLQEASLKREKQAGGSGDQQAYEQDPAADRHSAGPRITPDIGDASDVSSSALGKRDSTSSTLSATSDGDTLRTPATSPRYQPLHSGRAHDPRSRTGNGKGAAEEETDVTQLLLDQTNPRHLPPPGLQEQLYEAFASDAIARRSPGSADVKLSREERITLARNKRSQQDKGNGEMHAQPLSQLELVSELKDVMAVLRARRQVIPVEPDESGDTSQ